MIHPTQLAALIIIASAFYPNVAQSAPPLRNDEHRPWRQGILMPSLALGGSFGAGNDINQLFIGAGVSYYVIHGLAIGLNFSDRIWILSRDLKTLYPGIQDAIPTNEFTIMPNFQYVFVRNPWFSPYVVAGTGPVFLNNKNGVLGEWMAGPGFYIGTGSPVFIDIGVTFRGPYPTDKCRDAFSYTVGSTTLLTSGCSWGWGIRGGLVLAFGVGKRRAKNQATSPEQPIRSSSPSSEPPSAFPQPSETDSSSSVEPAPTP